MNRKFLRRMTMPLIAACLVLADCSSNTTSSPGPTTAFAVMRFVTSGPTAGSLDTTFAGGRGIAITDIDPGLFDFALAAAVQTADNKILVGGSSGLAGQGVVALVRYNADGSLDTAFGSGGMVRTTLPGVAATASAIAVQPVDGKILVAALTITASGATGIALLRYNPTGTLDTTGFGVGNGYVSATIGSGVAGDTCALALQGDGKIVVAGASQSGDVVLYRYNTDGTLDTAGFGTAGTSGSTITSLGTSTAAMSPGIALQSTGKIVLVSGTNVDQVVLRYNTDGTLDTTFGPLGANGVVVTNAGGIDFANAVAVQADGGIVVVGHANVDINAGTSDISLVRYDANGTLDPTFGANNGIVTTDLNGRFDNAFSVALDTPLAVPTNILVSGNTGSGGFSQAVVLRYTSTGALDTTFNTTGYNIMPVVGPSNIASGNAVVLQSALGIIVAGYD
jgi:uncharacterized delta-60 repeat protein